MASSGTNDGQVPRGNAYSRATKVRMAMVDDSTNPLAAPLLHARIAVQLIVWIMSEGLQRQRVDITIGLLN